MAATAGKKAIVEYSTSHVDRLDSWSLDIESDMLDVTSFTTGTVIWREFIAGLNQWSGTFSGNYDLAGSTDQVDVQTNLLTPTTAQVKLYVDSSGGENYQGSILIRRQSVGAEISGKVTINWDFQGTGTLTYSTTT